MSGCDQAVVAVDIGATKLAVRAHRGHRRWLVREPWAKADVHQLARNLMWARARLGGVDCVGVACAATLDVDGRVSAWPSRPSWAGEPVRDIIAEACGAPPVIGDDGALAALAEAAAAGCADLAYLGIGTGLGGGIVSGGRLVTGAYGSAGEIGHLIIGTGPRCRCSRTGCLQARVSGAALAARATCLRRRGATEIDLVAGLQKGRRWAQRTIDEAAAYLAHAVVALGELVQPARVHLGGGLGHALTDLPERVTAELVGFRRAGRPLPVVASAHHGAESSLAGAHLVARLGRVPVGDEGICAQAS